ncbi:MAG: hypothetical protein HC828_18515 [Blastochloris sp.]|nr:hypothetical protein [Blastochloris sp.]
MTTPIQAKSRALSALLVIAALGLSAVVDSPAVQMLKVYPWARRPASPPAS